MPLHNVDCVTQACQNNIDLINSMLRSSIRFIASRNSSQVYVTGLACGASDVTGLACDASDVTGLCHRFGMCHGICASDVTGLACGASDVTGLCHRFGMWCVRYHRFMSQVWHVVRQMSQVYVTGLACDASDVTGLCHRFGM